jgi:arginyl-tRNA synthetase
VSTEAPPTLPQERLRDLLRERLEELGWTPPGEILVERPRDPAHGDWSTNVAMALARPLRRSPRDIAADLTLGWTPDPGLVAEVSVAGPGFVNFRLREDVFAGALRALLRDPRGFLRSSEGRGRSVIVEFVSSNPTGPLHVGHARNAALGDAVAHLLEAAGWSVTREYYFNDAGRQMETLGRSLLARYAELAGFAFPFPEGGYEGDYLAEIARDLHREHGAALADPANPEAALPAMQRLASERMVRSIRDDLERFGVRFDRWFNESELYASGRLDDALARLRERGAVYEREGAVWFRASAWGDTEDRVLVKSTGQPTYFLPDIAYHIDKHDRGFSRAVNVWGADHHGYVPRMQAAMRALGYDPEWLHCIVYQAVTLVEGGETVRQSTRRGVFVTLAELLDEVGPDVTRYVLLLRRADTHLAFDLGAAKAESEENPVYYVQYAHARVMGLCERAASSGGVVDERLTTRSRAGAEVLRRDPDLMVDLGAALADSPLHLLVHAREAELLRLLADFPALVREAAGVREPHRVVAFLERLAREFHGWYHDVKILVEDRDLARARCALSLGVGLAVREGLSLLGIRAPETM